MLSLSQLKTCLPACLRKLKLRALLGVSVLALAACTNIPLEDVPVQDRAGTSVSALQAGNAAGDATSGAAGGGVTGVEVAGANKAQPSALERVVYFDFDSFEIRPEFASVLEANARYLAADNSRRLALEGHTDERGGREYNLALGQKRAEAVRRAMGLLGVRDNQMEAVSFGEEKPSLGGFDEAAFAKNRRVELTYR
ncbi:MAG: peptidoglycan-associated lipoprotein [Hydrogenophaga sp.]|jgi:peptidoglycan-associated lipoprotein